MIQFLDGPAADQTLAVRNAPEFLRVVWSSMRKGDGAWDALDVPGDTPRRGEKVYAYRRVGPARWMHLKASPRSASGYYAVAEYRLVEAQPDEATMRDTAKWDAWVLQAQREAANP